MWPGCQQAAHTCLRGSRARSRGGKGRGQGSSPGRGPLGLPTVLAWRSSPGFIPSGGWAWTLRVAPPTCPTPQAHPNWLGGGFRSLRHRCALPSRLPAYSRGPALWHSAAAGRRSNGKRVADLVPQVVLSARPPEHRPSQEAVSKPDQPSLRSRPACSVGRGWGPARRTGPCSRVGGWEAPGGRGVRGNRMTGELGCSLTGWDQRVWILGLPPCVALT